jgi:hypothetical protein
MSEISDRLDSARERLRVSANQPALVLHVCVCCLACGTVMPPALEPAVLCKTCGEPCSCPACRAGHPTSGVEGPGRAA